MDQLGNLNSSEQIRIEGEGLAELDLHSLKDFQSSEPNQSLEHFEGAGLKEDLELQYSLTSLLSSWE